MFFQSLYRMKSFLAAIIAIALGSGCVVAQYRTDTESQKGNSAGVAAGKTAFQQNCGFCHGPDGRGASGPDLIRSTLVSHDVNGDLIGEVVHNGRPQKGMPAFQLADSQIHQIAVFLHAQAILAHDIARDVPTDYPVEKLLVGNADAGKEYFNGAGKCSQCHSPTGDFAHIASKYKPLELQSRIAYPYGANPTAVVTDKSGHQFKGDLIYSDEFFITVLNSDGSQRTFSRPAVKLEVHDPLAMHVALLTQYTDKDIHDLFAYLETLK